MTSWEPRNYLVVMEQFARITERVSAVLYLKATTATPESHSSTSQIKSLRVPPAQIKYLSLYFEPGYRSRYSDSLSDGRSGDRNPVLARFSAPVQTGPEAHPASYTLGTGSFPGVKRQRRGFDHPPPSNAEVKERVELYRYSFSGPSRPVIG